MDNCNKKVRQLNDFFKLLLKENKDADFQIENAYEMIVQKKPYRIKTLTSMLFKVR